MDKKAFANLHEDAIKSIIRLEQELAARHGEKVILLAYDTDKI